MDDRPQREPMLERTLDYRMPERQRQSEEPGRGGMDRGDRDRDFEIGM